MRAEGPDFVEELMDELRVRHLGAGLRSSTSPGSLERLDAAYRAVADSERSTCGAHAGDACGILPTISRPTPQVEPDGDEAIPHLPSGSDA